MLFSLILGVKKLANYYHYYYFKFTNFKYRNYSKYYHHFIFHFTKYYLVLHYFESILNFIIPIIITNLRNFIDYQNNYFPNFKFLNNFNSHHYLNDMISFSLHFIQNNYYYYLGYPNYFIECYYFIIIMILRVVIIHFMNPTIFKNLQTFSKFYYIFF